MNPRKLIKRLNRGDILSLEEYRRIDEYRHTERIRQRNIRAKSRQKKIPPGGSLYAFPFHDRNGPGSGSGLENRLSRTFSGPTLPPIRAVQSNFPEQDTEQTLKPLALNYILNKDEDTIASCYETVRQDEPWKLPSLLS
ncbi:hypothetical protein POJ06DRAFT_266554 [Lipomyces tetrasporus]|uniref:Uncharacterized protein n=1 Tax=Lipomyces tetrasporus TaxID=54092 RepID=A0AAD7QUX8_9ASCO|nr:uncharacterized protein POJ06DRAFT_266554 [Lipomyces tetrasporus]KAJ8101945.1 hypothetical protein POJ06DRAFT_266554 [Lipomyces tetrasporus]